MNTQRATLKQNSLTLVLVFFAILLFSFNRGILGQSTRAVQNQVDQLMIAVRAGSQRPDISGLYATNKGPLRLIEASSQHLGDSLYKIRLEAYKINYSVALKAENITDKQRAVEILSKSLLDQNGTISSWGARHLSAFDRNVYTEPTKFNIVKGIQIENPKKAELIKIAGYLNLKEAEATIRQEADFGKRTSTKWAAYLALARMGDETYANRVEKAVRNQGLNDDVIYELVPDLIYTRQKACIDYAIETLYEDKKKCSSPNPDNPSRMVCGFRVMEYLAPVVQDFPFQARISGDIDTDNYSKALDITRKWFLEKGSSYNIIDISY